MIIYIRGNFVNSIVPVIIILIVVLLIIRLVLFFSDKIKFISKGLDSGFKIKEILLLWKLAKTSGLEDPSSLFLSLHALNRSIAYVISNARTNHTEHTKETQKFLSKLYEYRTKVELSPQMRKGLKSTKGIAVGQKLRIVVKGEGVFTSSVLNNGRSLTISLPLKDGIITIPSNEWISKIISVYLWRENDASYVFDTLVLDSNLFNSKVTLVLEHTDNLIRAQKRKSVRCQCKIPAKMFLIKSEITDVSAIEHEEGLRCIIEDISEGGAFVKIGGKGQKDMQIKLQFVIDESLVMMHGFVKAVEYNQEFNQSMLHFECSHIDPKMKNIILSYVYNVLPQEEKEIAEVINLVEQDEIESKKNMNQELQEELNKIDNDSNVMIDENNNMSSENNFYKNDSENMDEIHEENIQIPVAHNEELKKMENENNTSNINNESEMEEKHEKN